MGSISTTKLGPTSGPFPQFGYATPPPPPSPPGPLSYQGSIDRPYIWSRRRRPNIFFIPLAHVAPLPAQALEHPNTILELNLDANAYPNPQPAPHPTPNPTPDPNPNPNPNQDWIMGPSWWGKEHRLGGFNDKSGTHWKVDESGLNGAQNELYSSAWAPQLDWDHVRKTMVLTRF